MSKVKIGDILNAKTVERQILKVATENYLRYLANNGLDEIDGEIIQALKEFRIALQDEWRAIGRMEAADRRTPYMQRKVKKLRSQAARAEKALTDAINKGRVNLRKPISIDYF